MTKVVLDHGSNEFDNRQRIDELRERHALELIGHIGHDVDERACQKTSASSPNLWDWAGDWREVAIVLADHPLRGKGFRFVFDYHVHSTFSVDCKVPIEASCRAAIAAGVSEIAITDHVDHVPADEGFGFYRPIDYLHELDRVRELFSGKLTVLRGMEVDFNDSTVDEVARFMEAHGHQYDFVIGSVHYFSSGEMIFPDYFAGRTLDDVYLPYLDQVERAVDSGWFDSIGHLDLPKRYAPKTHRDYDPVRYRDRLIPIFDLMIARGVGFEINTSGLRQTPRTSMPGPSIVRWYVERGGQIITTGSDSHAAQTVGAGLAKTLDMLKLCGVEAIASFRNRTHMLVPISAMRAEER